MPAGQSNVAQPAQKLHGGRLNERLAARHLHAPAGQRGNGGKDFIDAHVPSVLPGVSRVAPLAAEVAAGEAHKRARQARAGRLALDAQEYLVDLYLGRHCGYCI